MAFRKAVRKIFTRDQEYENAPHASPQANQRRSRAWSLSTTRWWRNESSSRERPHISGPYDPFPKLAPGAESFDAQITSARLSQILIFYVYYDVVEVPVKNTKWSENLPWESLSGWIGLGMELKRTNTSPSKTLKLACDGLGIDAGQVTARLVRLSDRTSMLTSELNPEDTYETQMEKLKSDLKLVKSLRPTPQTQSERWKREIELCIRDYIRVVYLKVVNVGQFDPGPAITMEESRRRNDVRRRLNQVWYASREPLPQNIYDQAQRLLGRDSVALHKKLVRASGGSDGNDPRNSSSNGSERCRSRSNGAQLDQSNTWRHSAPDLNDLERVLNQMRAQCTRYAEDLRHLRLQQERTFAIQRADSFLQHEAAYSADTDINNHGNHISGHGYETSPSRQPEVFRNSFSESLPKSMELSFRRSSQDKTGATIITAENPYETNSNQSERRSAEWLRNQHEDDTLAYLPRRGHVYRSDEPSSQPMIRHRPTSGQKPSHLRNGVESKLASETLRQQHDANIEIDSPWATLGPIAALPSNQDRLRLVAHSPTLTHDPSLFMTPPSSPTMSMQDMPWRRLPGGWPPDSEAGPSRLGSPLLAISPPVRSPSRATMAGLSDIIDPDELTTAEAIRYQTRRAMASMVDLNDLPRRSSPCSKRRRGAEVDGDGERE